MKKFISVGVCVLFVVLSLLLVGATSAQGGDGYRKLVVPRSHFAKMFQSVDDVGNPSLLRIITPSDAWDFGVEPNWRSKFSSEFWQLLSAWELKYGYAPSPLQYDLEFLSKPDLSNLSGYPEILGAVRYGLVLINLTSLTDQEVHKLLDNTPPNLKGMQKVQVRAGGEVVDLSDANHYWWIDQALKAMLLEGDEALMAEGNIGRPMMANYAGIRPDVSSLNLKKGRPVTFFKFGLTTPVMIYSEVEIQDKDNKCFVINVLISLPRDPSNKLQDVQMEIGLPMKSVCD